MHRDGKIESHLYQGVGGGWGIIKGLTEEVMLSLEETWSKNLTSEGMHLRPSLL